MDRTGQQLALAVVVPVLNEAANVAQLRTRLAAALAEIPHEVIFVDDGSTDGTQGVVEALALGDPSTRLIRRHGRRGLSSAVVEGMCATVAPVVAVIDGDLQHDETILPALYRAIATDGAELAVGTRYGAGGSTGAWDPRRAAISRYATRLAAVVMKTRLSDPLSGFFAIRRDVLLGLVPRLSLVGYKLLLDIVASAGRPLDLAEVPYTFAERSAGESKLDSAVAMDYVELLVEKTVGRWIPAKLVLFSAVGSTGVIVHMAVLALLGLLGADFTAAQAGAVGVAMIYNFTLNNRLTYRDRRLTGAAWWTGLASFIVLCSIGAFANVGVGSFIYDLSGGGWVLGGLAGIAVGTVWNFVATSWLTWRRR
ncbi:glycosyltransferase family 2 protein [Alteriqipengyuania flavescens]|uniref:glycosyltransferase n=1 Tax=Alteriqipengyuania flavescens TaxID=3053610 RepID=UPI0025B4C0B7|nr:glycosyltransferase family 2 protein [Alteriqipengyuania flavescens]WJY18107.1 glycosyltransferase family 2 protein [Alteriqipengyuania flavescens]WJY24048.1 glycosyltransferase family 2 protein [Alteriqipengyuania flavescens]